MKKYVLLLLSFCVIGILTFCCINTTPKTHELLDNVTSYESRYGRPYIVYEQYPAMIGKEIITEENFNNGEMISVYRVKKIIGSYFLVVRNEKGSGIVKECIIVVP